MSEPITTTAVGAAIGAGVMAAIGIEPQPMYWALVGASLGLSAAASAGRGRAIAVFLAVMMCCSLLGTWVSAKYFGGETLSRNVCACVLAIFFHPLLNASVERLPRVLDAIFKKLGVE